MKFIYEFYTVNKDYDYEFEVGDKKLKEVLFELLSKRPKEEIINWLLDIADKDEMLYEFEEELKERFKEDAEQEWLNMLERED